MTLTRADSLTRPGVRIGDGRALTSSTRTGRSPPTPVIYNVNGLTYLLNAKGIYRVRPVLAIPLLTANRCMEPRCSRHTYHRRHLTSRFFLDSNTAGRKEAKTRIRTTIKLFRSPHGILLASFMYFRALFGKKNNINDIFSCTILLNYAVKGHRTEISRPIS